MQPQPFSLVGDGAGSIFKVFTTAAALDMGMGINANLDAPPDSKPRAWAAAVRRGCPKETWCVQNDGNYRGAMSVTDALAQSPNTAFAKLISQVGVSPDSRHGRQTRLAFLRRTRHGATLRPGHQRKFGRLHQTAEPRVVHAGARRGQSARTVQRGRHARLRGVWCPPSPIDKLYDRHGNEVAVTTETCDQVVPEGLANTLSNALSKDDTSGTAAGSAGSAGWNLPMSGKTGTTEAHRSSGFLGYTNHYAAAAYIYDDSPNPTDLCSWPCANAATEISTAETSPPKPGSPRCSRLRRTSATSPCRPPTPGMSTAPRLAGADRGGLLPGQRATAAEGLRLPGGRSGQSRQQRGARGQRRRNLPERADRTRVDHHHPW